MISETAIAFIIDNIEFEFLVNCTAMLKFWVVRNRYRRVNYYRHCCVHVYSSIIILGKKNFSTLLHQAVVLSKFDFTNACLFLFNVQCINTAWDNGCLLENQKDDAFIEGSITQSEILNLVSCQNSLALKLFALYFFSERVTYVPNIINYHA